MLYRNLGLWEWARHSKREWFSNICADILCGIVVPLALIPEAIGFSVIAGVDPQLSGLNL